MNISAPRHYGLILALILCLAPAALAQPTSSRADERELKAAYLRRFVEFVQWPESVRTNRIVIGLTDYEPYRAVVERDRPPWPDGTHFVYRPVTTPGDAHACHILFVNTSDRDRLAAHLAAVEGAPVLVVTDVRNGARLGAAINFFTIDGKIRFAINQEAAGRAGLEISARLLRLGRVVKGSDDDKEEP